MASPEVDWDRLDKTKVFFVGVPLFSAVTTALYPLTVIKTRQMASHGVSGGFSGSCQTAASIFRQDGVRGFYRGFGTVVFGTIPGRSVYLTTLEYTKGKLLRNEALIQSLAPTTLASTSNFIAGGVASLATQLVAVPVDVVSQRLMVHGADLHGHAGPASAAGGSASSSITRGSGSSALAPDATQQKRAFGSLARRAARAPPLQSAAIAAARQQLRPPIAAAQRCMQQRQGLAGPPLLHFSSTAGSGAAGAGGAGGASGTLLTAAGAGAGARMNGLQMAQLIVRQEGVLGLWRGLIPSAALYVPNSAIWWGCYGGWQSLIWLSLHPELASSHHSSSRHHSNSSNTESRSSHGSQAALAAANTGQVVAVQTAAAALAGACSAVITTPLDVLKTRVQVSGASATAGGGSGGGSGGVGGSGGSGGGQRPASWTGILKELLREEGPRGLWRGLAPRAASSSIFGVCMTVTYQALKRWCALPE